MKFCNGLRTILRTIYVIQAEHSVFLWDTQKTLPDLFVSYEKMGSNRIVIIPKAGLSAIWGRVCSMILGLALLSAVHQTDHLLQILIEYP